MGIDIVETLVVVSVGILPWISATVYRLKYPSQDFSYPMPVQLAVQFTQSIMVILVLLYVALNQPLGLVSIGLSFSSFDVEDIGLINSITAFVMGSIIIYSFIMLPFSLYATFIHKIMKKETDLSKIPTEVFSKYSKYRSFWSRIVFLIQLLLNVAAEELLFRGYFVILLGEKTGAVFLCTLISIALFVMAHLHYGRSRIFFYFWYGIALSWLTLSTGNIVWAISVHWCGNFFYVLKIWKSASKESRQPLVKAVADEPSQ